MSAWDPGLIILLVASCGAFWAYRKEKQDWNGGTCSECGCRWVWFDDDSQGGRGYKCFGCEPARYIWVSWPGID